MIGAIAIVAGYGWLIYEFGWVGLAAAALHALVFLFASRGA